MGRDSASCLARGPHTGEALNEGPGLTTKDANYTKTVRTTVNTQSLYAETDNCPVTTQSDTEKWQAIGGRMQATGIGLFKPLNKRTGGMNMSLLCKKTSLWLLAILTQLVQCDAATPENDGIDPRYEKPAIDVFGIKTGNSTETGFIFKDGVYIDAPYIVSSRGCDIYINDILVNSVGKWPPIDYDDKKPEFPKGLTRNSTFDDLKLPGRPIDGWEARTIRWYKRHYSMNKAQVLLAEVYRELPFVKTVELGNECITVVTWNTDKKREIDLSLPVIKRPTPEDVLNSIERKRTQWEKRLTKGDCFFLFTCGGEMSFGAKKAAKDLPAIVTVLRSDKPKDQKIKELQKLTLLPPDFPKKWEVLVTKFAASPQLDERVKKLCLTPGDKGERSPTVEEERARIEKMMKEKATEEEESQK